MNSSSTPLPGGLQILRQFGELPEDLVDMQRYAAWKAADIRKALREGRQPMPGNGNAAPDDLLPGVLPHEVRRLLLLGRTCSCAQIEGCQSSAWRKQHCHCCTFLLSKFHGQPVRRLTATQLSP